MEDRTHPLPSFPNHGARRAANRSGAETSHQTTQTTASAGPGPTAPTRRPSPPARPISIRDRRPRCRRTGRRSPSLYIGATPTPESEGGRGIASRGEQRRPSRLAEQRSLFGGRTMGRGRGVSYGGGQSSLSYLFGGDEAVAASAPAKPKPEQAAAQPATAAAAAAAGSETKLKGVPAGVRGSQTNNYFRAQGQNCGNFLTDRPSTKVHAAPGGGSSLDYLFGGGGAGK
ncbi:hypothetical protein U9M48_001534 [Paspalum notatum var. saurae]|uniref:Uncharacterized protein n=1 Tax=Paspalum notatum var. saurae TaxID=547442 RepID=A0AAQ3PIG6_PASNO